jgi:hypothetical protein
MTPTTILAAMSAKTTATQERVILSQVCAEVEQYLLTRDSRWLTEAIERCDAGEQRGGECAEMFRVARAKVQVYRISGDERLLEQVLEMRGESDA